MIDCLGRKRKYRCANQYGMYAGVIQRALW